MAKNVKASRGFKTNPGSYRDRKTVRRLAIARSTIRTEISGALADEPLLEGDLDSELHALNRTCFVNSAIRSAINIRTTVPGPNPRPRIFGLKGPDRRWNRLPHAQNLLPKPLPGARVDRERRDS